MKAIRKAFFEYVLNVVKILGVVLTLILWTSALLVTGYVDDMSIQITLFRSNNVLASIGIGLLFTVVCCLIAAWVHNKLRYKDKAFVVIVMAWICIVGVCLILFGKSVPGGDAMSVSALQTKTTFFSKTHKTIQTYRRKYPELWGDDIVLSCHGYAGRAWSLRLLQWL